MKMCGWFWGYPATTCYQLFALFQLIFFSSDTMTRVACGRNFSYSFIANFLKLYRRFIYLFIYFLLLFILFFYGLKMCICFWAYPPIFFINFFPLIRRCFSGLISIRMIPCDTYPTVFHPSFLNNVYLFYMV